MPTSEQHGLSQIVWSPLAQGKIDDGALAAHEGIALTIRR